MRYVTVLLVVLAAAGLMTAACADQKSAAPAQDQAQEQNAGVGLQTRDVRLGGTQLQTDLSRKETTNTANTVSGPGQIGGQRQEGTGNVNQTNVPEYIVDLMKENNTRLSGAITDRMDSLTTIGITFGVAVTLAILLGGGLMAWAILKQTQAIIGLPANVGREVGAVINGKFEKAVGNLLDLVPPGQRAEKGN